MLSRRDKLLIQPWEERRFRDHRYKVQSVLATVDNSAPAPRPHVTFKLKKFQSELERQERIRRDNQGLLQRLGAIMRAHRLDNRWDKPLPSLHQKVGMFVDADALGGRLALGGRARRASSSAGGDVTSAPVRCYACDLNKKTLEYNKKLYNGRDYSLSLPSID